LRALHAQDFRHFEIAVTGRCALPANLAVKAAMVADALSLMKG
jgi:hypothetical protein